MKTIRYQHEINEELEKRSGVNELTVIRLKGYNPSWELGGIRAKPLSPEAEAKLQSTVKSMQREFDVA